MLLTKPTTITNVLTSTISIEVLTMTSYTQMASQIYVVVVFIISRFMSRPSNILLVSMAVLLLVSSINTIVAYNLHVYRQNLPRTQLYQDPP
jgi:hypothetical protein